LNKRASTNLQPTSKTSKFLIVPKSFWHVSSLSQCLKGIQYLFFPTHGTNHSGFFNLPAPAGDTPEKNQF
jgi:hypothetical protein